MVFFIQIVIIIVSYIYIIPNYLYGIIYWYFMIKIPLSFGEETIKPEEVIHLDTKTLKMINGKEQNAWADLYFKDSNQILRFIWLPDYLSSNDIL